MLLLNARSVKNKWHEIYESIRFYNVGIVAITEIGYQIIQTLWLIHT